MPGVLGESLGGRWGWRGMKQRFFHREWHNVNSAEIKKQMPREKRGRTCIRIGTFWVTFIPFPLIIIVFQIFYSTCVLL